MGRGGASTLCSVAGSVMLERIATRRAELDLLEELVKRLADVRIERDELVVAEHIVQRINEQGFDEYLSRAPARRKRRSAAGRCG